MVTKEYAQKIFAALKMHYPHAKMILTWGNHFELLVSIILSAQCTDKKVNEITSMVFPKYRKKRQEFEKHYKKYTSFILSNAKDPHTNNKKNHLQTEYSKYRRTLLPSEELVEKKDPHVVSQSGTPQDDNLDEKSLIEIVNFAFVPITELEQDIKPTGFYHNKAKSVQNAAKTVLEKFHGVLPKTIAELTTIPGVGRKTANVFLTNAYHIDEGIAVDTHVTKQSQLLGLTKEKTPEKIEQDLMKLFPKSQWHQLTYMLIEHGRNMRRKKSDRAMCNNKKCILHDNE